MRRYDDPVEVRKGLIGEAGAGVEGPAQFLWHGRLWVVRDVVAHWVETGPWWTSSGVKAVIGSDEADPVHAVEPIRAGASAASASATGGGGPGGRAVTDLLPEREVWRVEAGRGMSDGGGVFDLSFDWADGRWQLVGCMD